MQMQKEIQAWKLHVSQIKVDAKETLEVLCLSVRMVILFLMEDFAYKNI